jgi:RND family efflux transporter MFP subunit
MNKGIVGAMAALVVLLCGCGRSNAPAGAGASAAPPGAAASGGAPVSVSTVRAQQRDVPVELEATGTVTALNSVDVKPQISSTITKVHFKEGQFVKAGQLLFTLDVRTDETNVLKAQAQLQKDLASLADAQRQLARSRELLAQNFISQTAVDTNQTLVDAQKAVVESDRAAIKAAQVGLSYTRIVAPSAGRAGSVSVFPGTSVQPGGPALVTITQLDPIAVTFNLPQRHLSSALESLRAGGARVQAALPERGGSLVGKLAFVDNAVDAGSGTVKVKAVFDNPGEKLWPGAFVGVTLTVQTLKGAIVVPQAAIVQGARGKIVFVVDADRKAQPRPVEVVHAAGTEAVVTGVRAGEAVVVDGRQNVRPGTTVVDRPAEAASGGKGGASGAAGAASGASSAVTGGSADSLLAPAAGTRALTAQR